MSAINKRLANTILGKRDEDVDRFHRSLGEFIAEFSELETAMQTTLWHFAGVKPPISQAIFSGLKIEGSIDCIRRVMDAKKWNEKKRQRYVFLFAQAQVINTLRNHLLHKGAKLQDDGTWISTNAVFAHIPEKITQHIITAEKLEAARADLFEIRLRLLFLLHPKRFPDNLSKEYRDFLAHA